MLGAGNPLAFIFDQALGPLFGLKFTPQALGLLLLCLILQPLIAQDFILSRAAFLYIGL